MKKQIYILACALFLISLQSCVDSIPIPNQEVDAKLRFISDISVVDGFKAKITTTADFDDIEAIGHPEDIRVNIRKANQDAAIQLTFDKGCGCYQNTAEKPEPGLVYRLDANVEDDSVFEQISSTMELPKASEISDMQAFREIQEDASTLIEANLKFSSSSSSGDYYHIIPFRKETVLVPGDGGEEEEVFTGNIFYLDLETFDNNNLFLEQNHNGPGFFVDFQGEDVASNPLNLLLHTDDVIDYESEAFTKVYYEVRSVTKSYYDYERYLSNKLDSELDGIVEAPIAPNNINNGLGYFGGYSTSMDSVLVQ